MVVKIRVPFWVPIIIWHLFFRVPQKGTLILTTTQMHVRFVSSWSAASASSSVSSFLMTVAVAIALFIVTWSVVVVMFLPSFLDSLIHSSFVGSFIIPAFTIISSSSCSKALLHFLSSSSEWLSSFPDSSAQSFSSPHQHPCRGRQRHHPYHDPPRHHHRHHASSSSSTSSFFISNREPLPQARSKLNKPSSTASSIRISCLPLHLVKLPDACFRAGAWVTWTTPFPGSPSQINGLLPRQVRRSGRQTAQDRTKRGRLGKVWYDLGPGGKCLVSQLECARARRLFATLHRAESLPFSGRRLDRYDHRLLPFGRPAGCCRMQHHGARRTPNLQQWHRSHSRGLYPQLCDH